VVTGTNRAGRKSHVVHYSSRIGRRERKRGRGSEGWMEGGRERERERETQYGNISRSLDTENVGIS
jgi:hypothetical protein